MSSRTSSLLLETATEMATYPRQIGRTHGVSRMSLEAANVVSQNWFLKISREVSSFLGIEVQRETFIDSLFTYQLLTKGMARGSTMPVPTVSSIYSLHIGLFISSFFPLLTNTYHVPICARQSGQPEPSRVQQAFATILTMKRLRNII